MESPTTVLISCVERVDGRKLILRLLHDDVDRLNRDAFKADYLIREAHGAETETKKLYFGTVRRCRKDSDFQYFIRFWRDTNQSN